MWLENGLNIRQVQILLGHESLETTILYLNYTFDERCHSAASINFALTTREPLRHQ